MKYLTFLLLSICYISGFSQQDPDAKRVLDAVADKVKSFHTMEIEFTMQYNNTREEIQSSSDGKIIIRDDKYVLETMGSKVIFDGENMYNIMEDIEEVTITKPDMDNEDFLSNPAKIFTWYNRDFKYRYKSITTIKGRDYHEIDLYPKNLDQPYSRIKVLVDAESSILYQIKSIGKNGEEYLFTITNFTTNNRYTDPFYQFNKADYPNTEIIDMRF